MNDMLTYTKQFDAFCTLGRSSFLILHRKSLYSDTFVFLSKKVSSSKAVLVRHLSSDVNGFQ